VVDLGLRGYGHDCSLFRGMSKLVDDAEMCAVFIRTAGLAGVAEEAQQTRDKRPRSAVLHVTIYVQIETRVPCYSSLPMLLQLNE
jgi:hypothetical protein